MSGRGGIPSPRYNNSIRWPGNCCLITDDRWNARKRSADVTRPKFRCVQRTVQLRHARKYAENMVETILCLASQ